MRPLCARSPAVKITRSEVTASRIAGRSRDMIPEAERGQGRCIRTKGCFTPIPAFAVLVGHGAAWSRGSIPFRPIRVAVLVSVSDEKRFPRPLVGLHPHLRPTRHGFHWRGRRPGQRAARSQSVAVAPDGAFRARHRCLKVDPADPGSRPHETIPDWWDRPGKVPPFKVAATCGRGAAPRWFPSPGRARGPLVTIARKARCRILPIAGNTLTPAGGARARRRKIRPEPLRLVFTRDASRPGHAGCDHRILGPLAVDGASVTYRTEALPPFGGIRAAKGGLRWSGIRAGHGDQTSSAS
jgi:hypothetical protein